MKKIALALNSLSLLAACSNDQTESDNTITFVVDKQ